MTYPLIQEIPYQESHAVFAHFSQHEGVVFLDSAELREYCGRYSFIALDPFAILTSKNADAGNPWQMLAEQLAGFTCMTHPGLPPFQGGVAGFFAYDLYRHLENVPAHALD